MAQIVKEKTLIEW